MYQFNIFSGMNKRREILIVHCCFIFRYKFLSTKSTSSQRLLADLIGAAIEIWYYLQTPLWFNWCRRAATEYIASMYFYKKKLYYVLNKNIIYILQDLVPRVVISPKPSHSFFLHSNASKWNYKCLIIFIVFFLLLIKHEIMSVNYNYLLGQWGK
jgi:uncharacterized integral membrane protein